jgi:LacI family transcriptional regulator
MAAAGLPVASSWVTRATPSQQTMSEALSRMLVGPSPVTAVFCGNNRITVLALRELRATRTSIALLGFDDLELADLLEPGITVVAQHTGELGRIAADMLFRRLGGYHGPPERVVLPATLIPRGSAELPPAAGP